jgi:uncharacterized protein YndB with AHSA1/START domain
MSNALTVTAPDGLPFVDFEREFDFPVELVFRAHRDPELFTQWMGPRGYEMELLEHDFTTGGKYRYLHRDGTGNTYAFRGVFHVVRENDFAIQTFEFEGFPDVVSIESLQFERLDGNRTRLRGHAAYPSMEARDGMVSSGMEKGMGQGTSSWRNCSPAREARHGTAQAGSNLFGCPMTAGTSWAEARRSPNLSVHFCRWGRAAWRHGQISAHGRQFRLGFSGHLPQHRLPRSAGGGTARPAVRPALCRPHGGRGRRLGNH